MTTCPMCDTIRIIKIDKAPYEKAWHVNCDCGWAWANSSFALSKAECKGAWENQMEIRKRYEKRDLVK